MDAVREGGQPGAHNPAQVGGHRKRFPWCRLTTRPAQRPGQLKPIERVPSRGVEEPADGQPRKPGADRGPHGRLESGHGQGANLDAGEAPGRQACPGPGHRVPVGLDPDRRQQPDRLVPNPPQGKLQRRRARTVDPLQVIDHNNDRSRRRQEPDHIKEREANGSLLGRTTRRILHQQGHLQSPALRRWQLGKHPDEDPVHQITERRERQRCLGFGRAGLQDDV